MRSLAASLRSGETFAAACGMSEVGSSRMAASSTAEGSARAQNPLPPPSKHGDYVAARIGRRPRRPDVFDAPVESGHGDQRSSMFSATVSVSNSEVLEPPCRPKCPRAGLAISLYCRSSNRGPEFGPQAIPQMIFIASARGRSRQAA
jgi:hypothetical protein